MSKIYLISRQDCLHIETDCTIGGTEADIQISGEKDVKPLSFILQNGSLFIHPHSDRIVVNKQIVPQNKMIELKAGDEINIGKTVFKRIDKELSFQNIVTFFQKSKFNAFFFHYFPILLAITPIFESNRPLPEIIFLLVVVIYVSIYLINLGYSYIDTFHFKSFFSSLVVAMIWVLSIVIILSLLSVISKTFL